MPAERGMHPLNLRFRHRAPPSSRNLGGSLWPHSLGLQIPTRYEKITVFLPIVRRRKALMVTRKKAITQILALLTVENAVFLVAVGVTSGMPFIVEFGISFDVILAVLVLGILVQRIVGAYEDEGRRPGFCEATSTFGRRSHRAPDPSKRDWRVDGAYVPDVCLAPS